MLSVKGVPALKDWMVVLDAGFPIFADAHFTGFRGFGVDFRVLVTVLR